MKLSHLLLAAVALPVAANAASFNWDPTITGSAAGGGSGTWDTTTAHWYNGTSDVTWGNTTADSAIFGGTGGTVTLGSAITANSLSFNSTGYTLTGSALTLGGTVPSITVTNAADSVTINSVITGTTGILFGGAGTINIGGQNTLNAPITINAATVNVGTGATLLRATTSGWTTHIVTIQNGGTLIANNWSNGIGNLWGQTGDASNNLVFSGTGGTFQMTGSEMSATVNKGITINSGATAYFKVATGTSSTWMGSTSGRDFIVNGTLDFNGGGNFTTSRIISGSGNLRKSDAGTLTLSGPISHTGTTTIAGGTLAIDSSAARTLSGALNGAGSLLKNNTGTLTLASGGNFSGSITVAGGALVMNGTLGTLTNLTMAAGTSLTLGGNTTITTGAIHFDGNSTLNFGPLSQYTGGAALSSATVTVGNGATVTLNLGTGIIASNTYKLIAHGNSLTGTTGFVLGTGPTLGARQFGNLENAGGSINYVVTGDSVKWSGAESSEWSTAAIGGAKNWSLATAGTATDYLEGDIVRFDDTATGTTVNIAANVTPTSTIFDNATKNYTLSGTAGITGTGALVKSGAGTLSISAQNSYTGGTTLNAGTLAITDAASLGAQSGALTFAGNATLRTLSAFSTTRAITLNSGVIGTIDTNGFNLTQSGVISGAGALVKTGAGTLALGAQNTYTGGTTVNAGVLDLTGGGGPNGTIRGTVTVNTGATLRLSTGDATGYAGGASSLSTINLVGGTLHVNTVANQTLGSAVINMTGATISGIANSNIDLFGNGSAINTLASATESVISLPTLHLRQNNTTFTVADGAAARDLVVNSNLGNGDAGNHNLIKAGAGNMVLTGTNGYTGSTSVNAGTLTVTGTTNGTNGITVNGGASLIVATGATLTSTGALGTADAPGSNIIVESGATLNLASAGIAWNTNTFRIDGALAVTNNLSISTQATTTMTGAGTITAGSFSTGNAATNVNFNNTGSMTIAGNLTLGSGGSTAFTQSAGTINAGTLQLNAPTSTYTLTGGTLNLGAGGITGTGATKAVNFGSATVGATAAWSTTQSIALTNAATGTTFNTTGGAIGLSGAMTGVGKLVKAGLGALTLASVNTYAGGTTVSAGTVVTANTSALGTGAVHVIGGTLQIGNGTVNAVTLGSGANLVVESGATLAFASTGSAIALQGAGTYTLGNVTLDLGNLFNTAGTYHLITGGSAATGTQGSLTFANFDNAQFSAVFAGGDLIISAIPEPSTYGLIGAGALGAIALVRRRRQATPAA